MALIKTFYAKDPHLMLSFAAAVGWEALDNYRFHVAIEVLDPHPTIPYTDGSTWTEVLAGEYTPDASGVVKVNVRAALLGVFTPTPPPVGDPIGLPYNSEVRKFRTKVGGVTGIETEPSAPTTTEYYLALHGGLSKLKFATLPEFFSIYLPHTRKFLTWAPLEKLVDKSQEDYLTFWFTDTPPANTARLRITAYYTDGTSQSSNVVEITNVNTADHLRMIRFKTGPMNSGVYAINSAKTLLKYTVGIANNVNTYISELRTYIIDPVSFPTRKFLMFLNSLGTWEVLRLYGDTAEEERYQRQVMRKSLTPGYTGDEGEFQQTTVDGQPASEMGTGYFLETDSKDWLMYMRDLMRSTRVFDVTKGSRVPLVITSPALPGPKDRNYKYSARFEALHGYSDEVYTPDIPVTFDPLGFTLVCDPFAIVLTAPAVTFALGSVNHFTLAAAAGAMGITFYPANLVLTLAPCTVASSLAEFITGSPVYDITWTNLYSGADILHSLTGPSDTEGPDNLPVTSPTFSVQCEVDRVGLTGDAVTIDFKRNGVTESSQTIPYVPPGVSVHRSYTFASVVPGDDLSVEVAEG
jgi:hypothetical protein